MKSKNSKPQKDKNLRKKKKWPYIVAALIILAGIGSLNNSSDGTTEAVPSSSETVTPSAIKDSNDKQSTKKESKEKKEIEAGSYTIDDIDFYFSPTVRNDVTGNWRISTLAEVNADVFNYCVDYYKELFSSDDEIHAIVNFSSKTTSKISVLYDGVLDVCVYDYVDGEEHYADKLFSGDLLKEDFISIETGEPVEF